MRNKKTIVLFCVFACCAAVLGLLLHGLDKNLDMQFDELNQEIYSLPPDTTAEELEAEGFLNLTDIQPDRLGTVNTFFSAGEGLLKTFLVTEEGPVIRIFARNEDTGYIVINKYYVKNRVAEDSGYSLNAQLDEIPVDDGIIEVWLRGTVTNIPPDVSNSPEEPEYEMLIYRYTK